MKSAAATDAMTEPGATAPRRYKVREYRLPAKVFHWITVALIVFMVASGVIAKQLGGGGMGDLLFGLHKLIGALTLGLLVLRIGYRIFRSLPAQADQPQSRPLLHWALYAVVVLVPLLGWAGISDFGARETLFGITLPAIWPEGLGYDALLLTWHAYAAFALLALVTLHIGIAIQDYMTTAGPQQGE